MEKIITIKLLNNPIGFDRKIRQDIKTEAKIILKTDFRSISNPNRKDRKE